MIDYRAAVNKFLISEGDNFTSRPKDTDSVTQSFM